MQVLRAPVCFPLVPLSSHSPGGKGQGLLLVHKSFSLQNRALPFCLSASVLSVEGMLTDPCDHTHVIAVWQGQGIRR